MDQSPLSAITMSSADGPARIVVHGQAGTGKTTLACYLPNVLGIGAEEGIPRDLGFPVGIIRPTSWLHFLDIFRSLIADDHNYQSVFIDTLDWVEPLLHAFVCDRDSGRETEMNKKGKPLISIEDYGYGRGFLAAEEEFVRFLGLIDVLQYRRRMHVAILMHTIVRTMKNPMGPDYDRYEPKCHQRVSAKAMEWAENVAFLHFRRDASKISEDKERHKEHAKAKAVEGVGVRLVGLQDSALYDAKNRVRLPPVIDMPANPNELVGMLLGDHLRGGVNALADRQVRESPAPRDVAPSSSLPPSRPAERTIQRAEPEPARRDDYYPPEPVRDNVVPIDRARAAEPPPQQPAASTSRPPPHARAAAANDKEAAYRADLTSRVDAAVKLGGHLGPAYREEMRVWLERCEIPDPKRPDLTREMKLEAIIKRIHKNVDEARSRQQSTQPQS